MIKRVLYLITLIIFISGFSAWGAIPSLTQSEATESDTLQVDGPYLFWLGDRAVMQCVCGDEVLTRRYDADEPVVLSECCGYEGPAISIARKAPSPVGDVFEGVSKICAVSDIHGKYESMIRLLGAHDIIDAERSWIWGDGHLVIVGDIFDRGAGMNKALWFVYRLEQEAEAAGGRVHFLLGNHEIMVMRGDDRYLNEKYRASSKKLRIKVADLYGPESELGRWLRSKPVMIRINDILFVHAGVSPVLIDAGYTIGALNARVRETLDLHDHWVRLDASVKLLYGYEGPFWYRGFIRAWHDIPQSTDAQVDAALSHFRARHVVIGHTIMEGITPLYGGKVLAIETGMHAGNPGQLLIREAGLFFQATVDGVRIPME